LFLYVDKNELITFKSGIRNVLVCLRRLHFVLYLPAETKVEKTDLYWFDLNHRGVEYEINEVMLLYTIPYLLNSQRQVQNHTFGLRSTINNKMNHIQWLVDRDPLSINTTLIHFRHVNSLELDYDIIVRNHHNSINDHIDLNCLGNKSESMFLVSSTTSFALC
jgi:hypothetical protein